MGESAVSGVRSAITFDPDGAGIILAQPVVGGNFWGEPLNSIARFDGAAWLPLGSGVGPATFHPYVTCMAVFEDALVTGGQFLTAGGVSVQGLARWDGVAWRAFPDERAAGPNTLTVLGGSLYAGGRFLIPGSTTQRTGVLRWDDPTWVSLGQNSPNDDVRALALYRSQLVAGGDFINAGQFISAFDGSSWQPLSTGLNGRVYALIAFDPDGPGPMPELLVAGGSFTTAGGQPASGIAAWDGSAWTALGSGTTGAVRALTVWKNQLVVAGLFYSAGGLVSPGMAFWGCPTPPGGCYPNCDGSTIGPMLNVADFICFINRYAEGDPYANCDGSTAAPVLNVADFVCYMSRFAAGCR